MPRSTVACLCGLLQLCLVLPAAAQFVPVRGREYREVFNPTNPVRGEAVVGVAIVSNDRAPRGRVVEVWLPERLNGELQVETATADGRFRGEGAYSGSGEGRQWVTITLTPTQAGGGSVPPLPGDAQTLALAVRGPGQTFYAARWGAAAPGTAQQLRVFVNSRRADMFLRAGTTVVRCTPLNLAQPLRFDHTCDVPLTSVPADGNLILIRRDQTDEQTQPFTVNLREIR